MKKTLLLLTVLLIGVFAGRFPELLRRYRLFAVRSGSASAGILLDCASENISCLREGRNPLETVVKACPDVACFGTSRGLHPNRSLHRTPLPGGETVLSVSGWILDTDRTKVELWVKKGDDTPVQCLDPIGWTGNPLERNDVCRTLTVSLNVSGRR